MKLLMTITLLCLSMSSFAQGVYIGKVQPYFYNSGLYLRPVETTTSNPAECATRPLLRLKEADSENAVFQHKFSIILAAWYADRTIELRGDGTCSAEGDEYIIAVMPH